MSINVLTAEDTLTVYDRVLTDFADGDVSSLAYSGDIMAIKVGKNKNSIFSKNENGSSATLTLRLIRGSSDDRFMSGKLSAMNRDFVSQSLATGELVKRLGDGSGGIIRDVYTLLGGTFQKNVDGKENVEGDTEQAVAVYTMIFANVKRSQQ
jgi:hypothetical protein